MSRVLTKEQEAAVEQTAAAFGWDRMALPDFEAVAWCSFHYLAMRFNQSAPLRTEEDADDRSHAS